jgi:hypothetical protein
MSVEYFEGGAGTGKTTKLMAALQQRLEATPLADGQSILALTFMHGSRQRLGARLVGMPLIRHRHECMTIDSFAWQLVCRWRGALAAEPYGTSNVAQWSFEERCQAAARLLAHMHIQAWVCRRFPVIIADELQDVRDARLSIIQALAQTAHIIGAADEFQDLGNIGNNPAVLWLRAISAPTVLDVNHRTICSDLLGSAADLRTGRSMANRDRCKLLSAANPNVAAGMIACNLVWFGVQNSVILTPTGPDSSAFVRNAVERLRNKPIKPTALKGAEVGPFQIQWESRPSTDASRLVAALELQDGATDVDTRILCVPLTIRGGRSFKDWIDRQRRVFGRERISVDQIRLEAERVCQQLRARRPISDDRLRGMTCHQAKNREFDRVIVLWPYEVSGCPEKLRRLLYNAITRAKQRAVIIVQNPPNSMPNRVTIPPFVI